MSDGERMVWAVGYVQAITTGALPHAAAIAATERVQRLRDVIQHPKIGPETRLMLLDMTGP
jgi:hypothetical protein